MPEGDTIFRSAVVLRRAIDDGLIESVDVRDPLVDGEKLVGATVEGTEARGKHLLMHLSNGRVLHSHMGLHGAWHLYRPGDAWQKSPRTAVLAMRVRMKSAVAATGRAQPDADGANAQRIDAVCFQPEMLELLTADQVVRHRYLQRLGPDLLSPQVNLAECLARFRVHNGVPLGEAVMNQTITSGIGNIYKSEVLFIHRFDPFAPVASYSDDELTAMLDTAQRLLKRNSTSHHRQTRFRGDGKLLWAYGREDQPCYECGAVIQIRRQGDAGRTTYWCATCQPRRA